MTRFPFRIGRDYRVSSQVNRHTSEHERRIGVTPPVNDVYLREQPSSPFWQVSREHCAIEYVDGRFFVVDRESACGTIVAEQQIGGNRAGGRVEIRPGETIVLGTPDSPYIFKFEVAKNQLG